MIKIDLTYNGRRLAPGDLSRVLISDLRQAVEKDVVEQIERRLKAVRCPKTGAPIKFTRRGQGFKADWTIEGSDEAIAEAKRVIGDG